jgi:hypothetical protein
VSLIFVASAFFYPISILPLSPSPALCLQKIVPDGTTLECVHMPLADYIQWLYASPDIAKQLHQCSSRIPAQPPQRCTDIMNSHYYYSKFVEELNYPASYKNLLLYLFADGAAFMKQRSTSSTFCLVAGLLNLPGQ